MILEMTDIKRSKTSVIITTYNSPDFLKKCINSFLFQKDKDFELIVGDDGSTQDTKKIISYRLILLEEVVPG